MAKRKISNDRGASLNSGRALQWRHRRGVAIGRRIRRML